jgi:hypothetical protein
MNVLVRWTKKKVFAITCNVPPPENYPEETQPEQPIIDAKFRVGA